MKGVILHINTLYINVSLSLTDLLLLFAGIIYITQLYDLYSNLCLNGASMDQLP